MGVGGITLLVMVQVLLSLAIKVMLQSVLGVAL